MGGRAARRGRAARLLIDLTPVRRSRDLRCLVLGELISVFGTQLTTVAVPYQVYQLTRSSLDVGLVSLTQLFPLIAGSLLGGSVVDAIDRRRLLMVAQTLLAGCSAGLAVNADLGASLWPVFVLPVFLISPQPVGGAPERRPGLRSIIEGCPARWPCSPWPAGPT
ncbi:MAG TPA: MFS transporter [Streptosporangiaceae bacterium]